MIELITENLELIYLGTTPVLILIFVTLFKMSEKTADNTAGDQWGPAIILGAMWPAIIPLALIVSIFYFVDKLLDKIVERLMNE